MDRSTRLSGSINESECSVAEPCSEGTEAVTNAAFGSARLFWWVFVATALFKLVLSGVIPLTGDEAYFVIWGHHLDYGYYDHGAMTGWMLWLVLLFGQSTWLVRLPAVVASLSVGLLLRQSLRPLGSDKANLAALLFLLSPVNLVTFFVTTDTPLLFFSALAGVWGVRAVRRESTLDWFVSGLFLGMAFLSKYFAVLLGFSFAVALLGCGVSHRRFRSMFALAAGVLPAAALNIAWNVNHSWVNILFNVYNRNASSGFNLLAIPLLFVLVALLAGPGLMFRLLRRQSFGRRPWSELWGALRQPGLTLYFMALVVPLSVLLMVSPFQTIGLHWLISFIPFFFPIMAVAFEAEALRRMLKGSIIYASVIAGLIAVVAFLPPEGAVRGLRRVAGVVGGAQAEGRVDTLWKKHGGSVVIGVYAHEVLEALEPYRNDYLLTSRSYSQAALLGFYDRADVPVLGRGSYHARQVDLLTDFRELDGKALMVIATRRKRAEVTTPWFDDVEIREVVVRGARLFAVLGRGFRYATYRQRVLQVVADDFYTMPAWLRHISRPCFFRTRYGFAQVPEEEDACSL